MTSIQLKNLKTHCRIKLNGKWYWATIKNRFYKNDPKPLVSPHLAIIDGMKINVKHFSCYECRNYQRKAKSFFIKS